RLEVQEIERNDRAVELPGGRPARAGRLGREAAAQVLAPGAGCRPEVHDELSRTDEAERLVDFLELVGGARAVALLHRELHVRVVDMVVEPRLVDLLALCLDFHRLCEPRIDNTGMTALTLTPTER